MDEEQQRYHHGAFAGSSPAWRLPRWSRRAATTTTTSSSDETTTTAPTDDVCADREALSSSVDALKDIDVAAEGTNGVTAAVADVETRSRGAARLLPGPSCKPRWTTSSPPSTTSTQRRPTSTPKAPQPRSPRWPTWRPPRRRCSSRWTPERAADARRRPPGSMSRTSSEAPDVRRPISPGRRTPPSQPTRADHRRSRAARREAVLVRPAEPSGCGAPPTRCCSASAG